MSSLNQPSKVSTGPLFVRPMVNYYPCKQPKLCGPYHFSKAPYPIFLSCKWASWPQSSKTWIRTCHKKHHTYSKQGQNYEGRTPFLTTGSVPNFFVVKTGYLLAAKGLGFTVTVKES